MSVVDVLVGSIRSACEDTSTVSVVEATVRVIGNSDNEPTVIVKWENALVAKPGALTVSVYDAGGNARMLYSPLPLADAGCSVPFASSRTFTVAPVTKLPFGSLTVTCRSPLATPCP